MKYFAFFLGSLVLSAFAFSESLPGGYMSQSELDQIGITQALPVAPATGEPIDDVDVAYFWSERSLLLTSRGKEAAEDDVYNPPDVWPRFSGVLKAQKLPSDSQLQKLFNSMTKAVADASHLVAPLKKDPPLGRVRPFVRFSESPTCLEPYDLVSGHMKNDYEHNLKSTGSYPSTHAAIGILWASVLAELYPQSKPQLFERGISFGESRAVCGFHFESDVSAGRVAGQLLFEALLKNKQFVQEINALKKDLAGVQH